MEASSSTRRRTASGLTGAMFSTRRGSLTTAIVAALLAGLLLFVFVQNYHKSQPAAQVNTPVFVASGYIPKGTPAELIASGSLMSRTTVPSNHVVVGAISDPSVLRGQVAAAAIYPGQQLTAADFTVAPVTITSQLTGTQRAIAIPVDAAQGLIGFVQSGDRVDVMSDQGTAAGGSGGVVTVASNVHVLSAPSGSGGGISGGSSSGGNIVLSVSPSEASKLAFAADNGKVWLTLRPPVGAIGSTGGSHK